MLIVISIAIISFYKFDASTHEYFQRNYRKYIKNQYFKQTEATMDEDLADRINDLSTSLSESVELISQMQAEIESRQALVDKLYSDAKTYDNLINLKKEEVEAVAQVFRTELVNEGKKTTEKGLYHNIIFLILGAIISLIFQLWIR